MALKRPYSTTNNPTAAPPLPPGPPPPPPPTGQHQQPPQQQQPQQQYYSYPTYPGAPPLPPGPPPQVNHPQYPGYGYGAPQVPTAPISPYANYSTQQPYAGQPAAITYGVNPPPPPPGAYGQVPQPQQGGNPYAAYGAPAYPQQQQPGAPKPPQYAGYPPPGPPNAYAIAAPPPPPSLYQPQGPPPAQHQQYLPAQGYDNTPHAGVPSPQGPPPLKRTRYDSMGAPQPMMGMQQQQQPMGAPGGGGYGMLPALPGINPNSGYSGRGGASAGRGRGGYSETGMRGASSSYGDRGGGGGLSPMGSRGGGSSYRGGRGDGPPMSSRTPGGSNSDHRSVSGASTSGRGGPHSSTSTFPLPSRGSVPPSAPFGPSSSSSRNSPAGSERGGSSSRGGRGGYADRGRPVSSLPRASRGGCAGSSTVPGGVAGAPKGPRTSKGTGMTFGQRGEVNTRELKKERKWGSLGGKDSTTSSREETKRTLTDFRISSLEIPQLEWEWKAEVVKAIIEAAENEKEAVEVHGSPRAEQKDGDEDDAAIKLESGPDIVDGSADPVPLESDPSSCTVIAPPPPSSPSKYDMSIDSIAPPNLTEDNLKPEAEADDIEIESVAAPTDSEASSTVVAPLKKKLSKKQRKAETAAKRAATLAAAATAGEETIEEAKKDGKHGRDEEEGDGLVITDVTAAKKVKPDNGEVVVFEAIEDEKPAAPTDATASSPSLLPPALPRQAHPLPPRPITAAPKPPSTPLPKSVAILEGIPTGPSASRNSQPPSVPPPPSNRENSRLRIYFSSPVASSSTLAAHQLQLRGTKENRRASIEPSVKSNAGTPVLESKPLPSEDVKEEDLDGVDVDGVDVDGEPVDDSIARSTTIEHDHEENEGAEDQGNETDDTDADQIQSALTANPSQLESELPTIPQKEEMLSGAVIKEETPSYPPDPYSLGSPSKPTISRPLEADSQPPVAEVGIEAASAPITSAEPSADRISISYARNTRRMVLDAGIVKDLKIFRADARIELTVSIEPPTIGEGETMIMDELRVCRGFLVEALDPELDDYVPVNRATLEAAWRTSIDNDTSETEPSTLDPFLPPLHRLLANEALLQGDGLAIDSSSNNQHEITITARLDSSNPLTEARWVKTGDVEGWITSLGLESKKRVISEWKGKITVSDPDPPPTIQHALDTWATSCTFGSLEERTSFVAGHLSDIDNVFEILLRLTRGDRATPHNSSASSAIGTLAVTLSAPYAEHQTQVSLAVLAMFRLSVETAAKAGIPKDEVEKQVGEIIRGIPYHLIFKSLDGMFREFKARAKKSAATTGSGSGTKR